MPGLSYDVRWCWWWWWCGVVWCCAVHCSVEQNQTLNNGYLCVCNLRLPHFIYNACICTFFLYAVNYLLCKIFKKKIVFHTFNNTYYLDLKYFLNFFLYFKHFLELKNYWCFQLMLKSYFTFESDELFEIQSLKILLKVFCRTKTISTMYSKYYPIRNVYMNCISNVFWKVFCILYLKYLF